jgi:malate dehydrogenase (oxaloacetate-decarboxylating)(NADP+)
MKGSLTLRINPAYATDDQSTYSSAADAGRPTYPPDGKRIMAQSNAFAGKSGMELLLEPELTKSTAFVNAEREALKLTGLLPDAVETEDMQLKRVLQQLGHKTSDIDRYVYLVGLLDHNETLFYRTLMSDPARFLPIVYDPTVGEACLKFGHIFRRPRGMYISIKHKGRVKEILRNWPEKDLRFICATSGERILGLGDLGANGMGIPIGKLQLYTACAGVPPQVLLPMVLDFGTNNESLLNDPLYLGIRETRPSVAERDAFVDEFVQAVQEVFPRCCIHFEDWAGVDAVRLLARYRDKVCCYNDDIQGTAGAGLVGIFSALRVTGAKLKDQRVLFLGAGSAGTGIAGMIVEGMMLEGLSATEAQARISMFDINGLLESSRKDILDFQKPYAHKGTPTKDFVTAIEAIRPTAIIGVSTSAKAFDQRVVSTMAKLNERPIIFALSNPTDHAECTAEEAYKWSQGRALFAAGVPFPPVTYQGRCSCRARATISTSSRQWRLRSMPRRPSGCRTSCSSPRPAAWRSWSRPRNSSRDCSIRRRAAFSTPRSRRRCGWPRRSSSASSRVSPSPPTWPRSSPRTCTTPNIGRPFSFEKAAQISLLAYREDLSRQDAALKLAEQFDKWVRPADMTHPLAS